MAGVKSQLLASTFKTWFLGSSVIGFRQLEDEDVLTVGVGNNFLKEQLETRYLSIISKIKEEQGLDKLRIIFEVSQRKEKAVVDEPLFSGVAPGYLSNGRRPDALSPSYTLDSFVVGASNNIAYLCAKQVVDNPAANYNPLLIYGPTGVGKTHLLMAIGNLFCEKYTGLKVLYTTSERFTNDYIESISNRTTSYFRQKYRGSQVLLVDDVHFLAGKESTQDEFFHTFDELALSGRQIVLVSDRHPRELSRLKDRLYSRLVGGMTCDIGYPDFEMKISIIRQKCGERGMDLTDEIVEYLANSQGGVRELEGLLLATLTQIKLAGGTTSFENIKTLVEKSRESDSKSLTLGAITSAVCKHFKIEEAKIKSSSRRANVNFARQVLMYLLRNELKLSLAAIGDFVGGRDHSTVIHGVEKVETIIINNGALRDEILRIKARAFK